MGIGRFDWVSVGLSGFRRAWVGFGGLRWA